ncbi:MAG: ABC transporter ATP-binding protein [Erysipelotrichaceae bacterium]|nr:ABC transporter ATP-binding protein [Erysipelotrichaceae bacterium]
MDILEIQHLSKRFGSTQAIDDLSFSVPEGSIFGFIGQNGAGKTTTMKLVLGLLKTDQGSVLIDGEKVSFGETKTNRKIGYLPDVPEFYNYLRAREYLDLCGKITGLSNELIKSRSDELLSLVGLSKVTKKIGAYSRGMKQRLGIAQALLNEPRLLICDEPTSALDPLGRKEILDILSQVKGKTTVLFSTHILSDVERICDHVAVISHGKLMMADSLANIKANHASESISIEFKTPQDKEAFMDHIEIKDHFIPKTEGQTGLLLQTKELLKTEALVLKILVDHNWLPIKFEVNEPSIESLFLEALQ